MHEGLQLPTNPVSLISINMIGTLRTEYSVVYTVLQDYG